MKITKITNTSLGAQRTLAHHLQRRPRRIHDNANFDAHAICCHRILYGWKCLKWDTFLIGCSKQLMLNTLWFDNQTPDSNPGKWKQFYKKTLFIQRKARGNKQTKDKKNENSGLLMSLPVDRRRLCLNDKY